MDFYYSTGKKYREWYFIKVRYRNGQPVKTYLENAETRKSIHTIYSPPSQAIYKQLHRAFIDIVREKGKKAQVVDAEITRWQPWEYGSKTYPRNLDDFPFQYIFENSKWVRKTNKW